MPSGASRFARRLGRVLGLSPPVRGIHAARRARSRSRWPLQAAGPVTFAHESFAPTRSARTPLVTEPPRHRLETDAVHRRRGRSLTADSNDPASRTQCPRQGALSRKSPGFAGPRHDPARVNAQVARDMPPAFTGGARSGLTTAPATHSHGHRRSAPSGTVGCRGRSRSAPPGPRAASPGAPRRAHEIRCTRGAFHR